LRPIYSLIFDLLTDPLTLPIHPIWEYVILLILGKIAFKIAWEASPGGFFGSTIHWFVRAVAMVAIWAVTYAVIVAGQFVIAHWIPIVCIIGGLVVVGISAALIYWHRNKTVRITG
jgi:CHASE2 domain-containing sensor protein